MSIQKTTYTNKNLWHQSQIDSACLRNATGAVTKGFIYTRLPVKEDFMALQIQLSSGNMMSMQSTGTVTRDGCTVTYRDKTEGGQYVFEVSSTSGVGVRELQGLYDAYSDGLGYTPFSMDIFKTTQSGQAAIPTKTFKDLFTVDQQVSRPHYSGGVSLADDGLMKLDYTASLRYIQMILRCEVYVEDGSSSDPVDCLMQVRRPEGAVIASAHTIVLPNADDLSPRELVINSYAVGGGDPYVESGFHVGMFNPTGGDLWCEVDSFRINIMINPPFIDGGLR